MKGACIISYWIVLENDFLKNLSSLQVFGVQGWMSVTQSLCQVTILWCSARQ